MDSRIGNIVTDDLESVWQVITQCRQKRSGGFYIVVWSSEAVKPIKIHRCVNNHYGEAGLSL